MSRLKDIIYYILRNYPYKEHMPYARFSKLLYLLDWYYLIKYSNKITHIEWILNNDGPTSDSLIKTIKQSKIFDLVSNINTSDNNDKFIKCKKTDYVPNLTKTEKIAINYIIDATCEKNWDDFIRLVYSTYPVVTTERYSSLRLREKAIQFKREIGNLLY